jgi:hemoglobin/transferrin/lactoferrin receptor protein
VTTGLQLFYEDAESKRDRFLVDVLTGLRRAKPLPGVIPDSTRLGIGVFAQDEVSVTQKFEVTLGTRFDWIRSETDDMALHPVNATTEHDSNVSANLGLLWRLTNRVNLTANVGRAFRAPTLLERFFFGPHQDTVDIGDPDLDPETSLSVDLGLKANYDRFTGTVSLFYNRIDDYIVKRRTGVTDPDSGLEITSWGNVDRAELYGFEGEADLALISGFSLFGTISFVRGRNKETDADLPEIPPLKGTYGILYENHPRRDWYLWSEFAAHSAARQDNVAPWETETPGYTTFDFRFGLDFKQNASLVFSAENLTDKSYHDHLSRVTWQNEQPGRSLGVKITWRW